MEVVMLDIADLIYKEYSENYSSNSPNFKARQEKEFIALKTLTDTLTQEQIVLLNDFINIRGENNAETEFELVNFVLDIIRQIFVKQ